MNIVILGAGVVGSHLAQVLSEKSYDVTVVDQNRSRLSQLGDRFDLQTVVGDVRSHEILHLAGCSEADLALSVTDNDSANVLTASVAKHLGAKKVIARVRNRLLLENWEEVYRSWLEIDSVIAPEDLTAREVAKRIGTAGFYVPASLSDSNVALQEWTISEDSTFLNRDLKDISEFENIIIPSIFRKNEILIPSGNDRLEPHDRFFMVGAEEDIQKISKKLKATTDDKRAIMIFGGGDIGYTLARILEKTRLSVKLVEADDERCKYLSLHLNRTMIINGSCLDEELLQEQGINNVDVFVAVTGDEEDNLMASLIAKELGAKASIVLSERQEFAGIMKRLGVDTTVSPKLITANSVLQTLDPGNFRSIIILYENKAEVVQVTVSASSKICGMSLIDASLPKGVLFAAVIRNEKVLVPHGDLILEQDDTVLIFTLNEHLPVLQKLFL